MAEKTEGYLLGKISLEDIQIVDVTLVDEDGCKISKRLSLSEYIQVLSEQSDVWTEIPKVPKGTVKLNWRDKENYRIAVFIPKDVRPTIFLKRGEPLMIPYPNLIFYFEMKNGTVSKSLCFAVKDSFESITDTTKLYNYPFGNVSTSGSICWGGNFLGILKGNPQELEKRISLFFDAATNTDLYEQGVSCKKSIPLEELYNELNGKEFFDEELLQESRHQLGSLFN